MLTRRRLLSLAWVPFAAASVPVLAHWRGADEPRQLAEFRTSLAGRTRAQRHNARWAVHRLHGAAIGAGADFSFNRQVGPWTRDEGVLRAPVSYGGILVPSWGGGVCQVSTTFYCAALLAGLIIHERHPHEVAPAYIPAGMDAAVAFNLADLRIQNPLPVALRVECAVAGDQLICRLIPQAVFVPAQRHRLSRELVASQSPPLIDGSRPQPGRAGVRVRLWRISDGEGPRERQLCHETEYAPLPRSA